MKAFRLRLGSYGVVKVLGLTPAYEGMTSQRENRRYNTSHVKTE